MDASSPGGTDPAARRPTWLELLAGAFVLAAVVLHVVGMFPAYFTSPTQASVASQPDQVALFAVLAAGWALALAIGLTGPNRLPVAAGFAGGLAATELGFRVADLGDVFHYGTSEAGPGLWIFVAGWAAGTLGAVMAVVACRRRRRRRRRSVAVVPAGPPIVAAWPARGLPASPAVPAVVVEAWPADPVTGAPMAMVPAQPDARDPEPGGDVLLPRHRAIGAVATIVLALATAAFFLPPWDHYEATSTVTGSSVGKDLGNAFSYPWQVVIGNVLVAVALVAIPIAAFGLRNRTVRAALVCGALLALVAQFVAAVVQVDQPTSPGLLGLTPAQANQLGLAINLKLTGWFTLDALAALGLFAVVLALCTVRLAQANSAGITPRAPEARREPSSVWS